LGLLQNAKRAFCRTALGAHDSFLYCVKKKARANACRWCYPTRRDDPTKALARLYNRLPVALAHCRPVLRARPYVTLSRRHGKTKGKHELGARNFFSMAIIPFVSAPRSTRMRMRLRRETPFQCLACDSGPDNSSTALFKIFYILHLILIFDNFFDERKNYVSKRNYALRIIWFNRNHVQRNLRHSNDLLNTISVRLNDNCLD